MRILFDTHTHSVASGHAYSTLDELAKGARRRGLKGFVLTDHGPGLPGGTHPYHFGNLRVVPTHIKGVRFFSGVEANIMGTMGELDLGEYWLGRLDFVMAGLHEICFAPRSSAENTQALIAAIANPFVDALSHPDNPAYPMDMEAVVTAAAASGKALEINDSSFRIRPGSAVSSRNIALLCKKHGVLVTTGSDAHYWKDVGRFDEVRKLLREVGMPDELVLNANAARFKAFLEKRRAERAHAAKDYTFSPT